MTVLATIAALAAASVLAVAPAHALDAGAPAPALKLPGAGNATVDLTGMAGKVVYVDFWASWCAPCRLSFPWMNEVQARHRAQGLQVVAVNVDAKREAADRFLAEHPASFTIAYDAKGETPRRWEVKGMPTSVLVGRDGTVLWVHRGFRNEDRAELDRRIAAALAAK
jgi:cytochrome c biogenesis protein CcmG, thiol:disulfide interchange protein DsbE